MVNYYVILNISRNASLKEIKTSYKKLALKYHPDKNQGNKNTEELFKQVNEAYQTLSNDSKRIVYDQKLEYHLFILHQRSAQTFKANQNQPPSQKPPSTAEAYNQGYKPNSDFSTDYSTQGKHYKEREFAPKEKKSDHYILGITLFIIIATVCLILGFMMNRIAAQDHYKSAVNNFKNEQYLKAIMELNNAIHFDESFVEAYELRADCKVKIYRYEHALSDYNRAIKYCEDPSLALINKRNACKNFIE